jgi:NADH-quinone oxidoreductase subunit J
MPPDLAEKVIVAGLIVAAVGLWLAMPQRKAWLANIAGFAAAVGLLAIVRAAGAPSGDMSDRVLFWIFATGAVGCGLLMITSRDPVHGALWFAVSTLSVCGLFLQLRAPFLAAATVIVYAGAIIVTFMFVIMLAQQAGATLYDQRARLPLPAICVSFFVLGALIMNLERWRESRPGAPAATAAAAAAGQPDAVPQSPAAYGSLRTLGRTLFGEHLFAVEVAGTLLLIATVGAIALAPRRTQGTL